MWTFFVLTRRIKRLRFEMIRAAPTKLAEGTHGTKHEKRRVPEMMIAQHVQYYLQKLLSAHHHANKENICFHHLDLSGRSTNNRMTKEWSVLCFCYVTS